MENRTRELATFKKILSLVNKLKKDTTFFKNEVLQNKKMETLRKCQRIGVCFCYNKWSSSWRNQPF